MQPDQSLQFLLGKIEAVEHMGAALAAVLSPATVRALLVKCEALRLRESQGTELDAREKGFLSVEHTLLHYLKEVSAADRFLAMPDDSTPQ